MNSMKRSSTPVRRAQSARGTISSSFTPRSTTALIFTGEKPASLAASMPSSTLGSSSRRVMRANLSRWSVSRLMLTRSRPAWRSSWASSRNVAPFVVIDRSGLPPAYGDGALAGTRSTASMRTSTGRWARTVGSPPVSRNPSTPNRSTNRRARRVISSNVSTSLRGSHCIPSSGMQYVQRKLQRSVIEMRRSRMVRPNGSTRSSTCPMPVIVRQRLRIARGGSRGHPEPRRRYGQ